MQFILLAKKVSLGESCHRLWIYGVVRIQCWHLADNCNYVIAHREPLTPSGQYILCIGQSVGLADHLPENGRVLFVL